MLVALTFWILLIINQSVNLLDLIVEIKRSAKFKSEYLIELKMKKKRKREDAEK